MQLRNTSARSLRDEASDRYQSRKRQDSVDRATTSSGWPARVFFFHSVSFLSFFFILSFLVESRACTRTARTYTRRRIKDGPVIPFPSPIRFPPPPVPPRVHTPRLLPAFLMSDRKRVARVIYAPRLFPGSGHRLRRVPAHCTYRCRTDPPCRISVISV